MGALLNTAELARLITDGDAAQKIVLKAALDILGIAAVTAIPGNTAGVNGGWAINQNSGAIYRKSGGVWTTVVDLVTQGELATAISGVTAGTAGDPRIEVIDVPDSATGMSFRVAGEHGGRATLPGLQGTDYQESYYDANLKQFNVPNGANGSSNFNITLADLVAINTQNRRDDVEGTRFWVVNLKTEGDITFSGGGIAQITPSGETIKPGYAAFVTFSPFSLSSSDQNRHFRLVIASWKPVSTVGGLSSKVTALENRLALEQGKDVRWSASEPNILTITSSTAESNANRRRTLTFAGFTFANSLVEQISNVWLEAGRRQHSLTLTLKMRINQVASGTSAKLRVRLRNTNITTSGNYREALDLTFDTSDSGDVDIYHVFRMPANFLFVSGDDIILQLDPIFPSSGAASSVVVRNIEIDAALDTNPQNGRDIADRLEADGWRNPRFSEMEALWGDTSKEITSTQGFILSESFRNFTWLLILLNGGKELWVYVPDVFSNPYTFRIDTIQYDSTSQAALFFANGTTNTFLKFNKDSNYALAGTVKEIYGIR